MNVPTLWIHHEVSNNFPIGRSDLTRHLKCEYLDWEQGYTWTSHDFVMIPSRTYLQIVLALSKPSPHVIAPVLFLNYDPWGTGKPVLFDPLRPCMIHSEPTPWVLSNQPIRIRYLLDSEVPSSGTDFR